MRAQKVMVQITGTQRLFSEWPETADSAQDGGADSTETAQTQQTLPGLYSCQKGAHFVVYEEDDGEGHVTRSTVKITEDSFEVMRKGAGCVRMAFRAGRRSECWYDTPCGRMPVVFDVKETEICLSQTEGAGADNPGDVLPACAADNPGDVLLARAADNPGGVLQARAADNPGDVLLARAAYVLEMEGRPVSENTVLVRVSR